MADSDDIPLILTPTSEMAESIRRQSKGAVRAHSIFNIIGLRGKLIIVMRPPWDKQLSRAFMDSWDRARIESVPCRLLPGGVIIDV